MVYLIICAVLVKFIIEFCLILEFCIYTHTIQMVFCVSTMYVFAALSVYIHGVCNTILWCAAGKLIARMATPMAHTIITHIFIGIVIEFE